LLKLSLEVDTDRHKAELVRRSTARSGVRKGMIGSYGDEAENGHPTELSMLKLPKKRKWRNPLKARVYRMYKRPSSV
jgi:hypothetical protein